MNKPARGDGAFDRRVVSGMLAITTLFALTLPVNPFPRDDWFGSQYHLFGHFPSADNYPPIAVPAVFYKTGHWLAAMFGANLTAELYLDSLAQNCLVFLAACLIYKSCKYVSRPPVAAAASVAVLLLMLSAGLAQAFWSENVVLLMYSCVLVATPHRSTRS